MDYIVIDTEGKDIITEIAIIDSSGELIIEEFVEDNLEKVLNRVEPILTSHIIIAHNATHDSKVLRNSYRSIGKSIRLKTICSVQKSKKLIPNLYPHSLDILSQNLFLKYNDKYFNRDLAHRASYDARFTYLLYNKLLNIEKSREIAQKVNPFSSSKVDNPFQEHFDDKMLYQDEFKTLLNLIDEIKNDTNSQSKSALVIGEAGNGKTHLMMRFLNRVSATNRFLFIGKPNNKDRVLFHTYSKILESFIQKIDNSPYSQLDYLLAKSFSAIIIENSKNQKVIDVLTQNHLNIYTRFGKDGTDNKMRNWNSLEKTMLKWYRGVYGNDLLSINIFKALIKYTFYKDENRKDIIINYLSGKDLEDDILHSVGLEALDEDINLEEFSLKAISLFGKISIFDEPLIISFDQLEAMSSDKELLIAFAQNIKELITNTPNSLIILNLFPNRWREYEALFDGSIIDLIGKNRVILERPPSNKLKIMLKDRASKYGIDLDTIFVDNLKYEDILQHNSIRSVLNRASDYFKFYTHNIPLPKEIDISLESRFEQLLKRVEHLESLNHIQQTPKSSKIDFNIDSYIDTIYNQKLKEYERKSIIDDKNDIDKLKFILQSIDSLYSFELDFFKMKKVLPEHIIIITSKYRYVVGFLHLEGRQFVGRIKNFNQLVVNNEEFYFRLFRDARESAIRGKVSKGEQDKLDNSKRGRFVIMDRENRVIYETIYQLIIDLSNRDIEVELKTLIDAIFNKYSEFWLCKLINS